MGCTNSTPGISGGNPDHITAQLDFGTTLRLSVVTEPDVGRGPGVALIAEAFVENAKLPNSYAAVMSPAAALDLALRITAAVARLRKSELNQERECLP